MAAVALLKSVEGPDSTAAIAGNAVAKMDAPDECALAGGFAGANREVAVSAAELDTPNSDISGSDAFMEFVAGALQKEAPNTVAALLLSPPSRGVGAPAPNAP